jgi:hypothetical protein
MKRIGLAASEISKGNIVLYNFYVILISCLFSFFIFLVVGTTIIFALMVIAYMSSEITGRHDLKDWYGVVGVCMATLTVVTVAFNLFAIMININIPRKKR